MALLTAIFAISILSTVPLPTIRCAPLAITTPNKKVDNVVEEAFNCYAERVAESLPGGLTEHEKKLIRDLDNAIEVRNNQM